MSATCQDGCRDGLRFEQEATKATEMPASCSVLSLSSCSFRPSAAWRVSKVRKNRRWNLPRVGQFRRRFVQGLEKPRRGARRAGRTRGRIILKGRARCPTAPVKPRRATLRSLAPIVSASPPDTHKSTNERESETTRYQGDGRPWCPCISTWARRTSPG